MDDAGFVAWLLAHAEPAPYGEGGETKLDKNVRDAQRLVARGKAEVHGFDPASLLDTIASTLSPGTTLTAELTDVIVYSTGGKFARHKDTPRTADLIGTLVVGLPIAHTGGGFVIDGGDGAPQKIDWGEPMAGALPWVALFSDADHEIEPVTSGTRATLVYALHRTDTPRVDKSWDTHRAALRAACAGLAKHEAWPLMIACGRHVIAAPQSGQPQEGATARGLDRELVDALVDAGFDVTVRACLAALPNYELPEGPPPAFPILAQMYEITRLKKVPPPEAFEAMGESSFDFDDFYLDDIRLDSWVIRKSARAALATAAGQWGEGGYFGNEGYDALLYTLGALEVERKGNGAKPVRSAGPRARRSEDAEKLAKNAPATVKASTKKPLTKKTTARKATAKKETTKKAAAKTAAAKTAAAKKKQK